MKHILVVNDVVDTIYLDETSEGIPEAAIAVEGDVDVKPKYLVSGDAQSGWVFTPPTPIITNDDVNAERARRKALGAPVNITGIGEFTMDTRANTDDMINITGLTLKGTLLVNVADTLTTVSVRDSNNVDRDLTGAQLVQLGEQVAAHHSVLYECSWALKDLETIPTDYTDDQYWSLSYWAT